MAPSATIRIAPQIACAWSIGTSITGGSALPSARLVLKKNPGTEKTHSTSTRFVMMSGARPHTRPAVEGYVSGAAWWRTTAGAGTPFARAVRTWSVPSSSMSIERVARSV